MKRRVPVFLFCLLGGVFISTASARCVDYGRLLHPLDLLSTPRGNACAAITGSRLYIGGANGANVRWVDAADPAHLRSIAEVQTGACASLAARGHLVYAACGDDGVRIVDFDPAGAASPRIVSTVNLYGPARGVALQGNFAYVAGPGFHVIDISDSANPRIVGSASGSGPARCVAVSGNHAYVGADTWVRVIDISDPTHPFVTGELFLAAITLSIAASGNHAYLAGLTGLRVIDVADPLHPYQVGSLPSAGYGPSIALSGRYAFVATNDFEVIDIADPENPRLVGRGTPSGSAVGIAVAGGHAYLATGGGAGFGTVESFDVSLPFNPQPFGELDLPYQARAVALTGTNVCFGGDAGLAIVDVAEPRAPRVIGSLATTSLDDMAVAGSVACALGWINPGWGLFVIDLLDPEAPEIIGRVQTGWNACVAISGDRAYVAGNSNPGLQVISLTDPTAPQVLGNVILPGSLQRGLAVAADHVYVANDIGLTIVDVADPAHPAVAGSNAIGPAYDVALLEDRVCLLGESWLHLFDVTHPHHPHVVGRVELAEGSGRIAISGSTAYVTRSTVFGTTIQVIDLSDAAAPRLVATIDSGDPSDLAATDDFLYAAGSSLQIFPAQCEADPARGTSAAPDATLEAAVDVLMPGAFPNPSRGGATIRFRLSADGLVQVAIHDASGRQVRELTQDSFSSGWHELAWDGKDAAGRFAPSGVYLAWVRTSSEARRARMVVVR